MASDRDGEGDSPKIPQEPQVPAAPSGDSELVRDVKLPPPPMPDGGTHTQINLAWAIQQGAWQDFSPEERQEALMLADRMDERQFKHAQSALELGSRHQERELTETGANLRYLVRSLLMALGGIGVLFTVLGMTLILTGNPEMAERFLGLMVTVLVSICAGVGIREAVAKAFGPKRKP